MVEKRTLTVSVTINLGNEENLKLEVTDSAETVEEAAELQKFLIDVLDGYGKNDSTSRSVIESYKERILLNSVSEEIKNEEETEIPIIPFIGEIPEVEEEPAFESIPASMEKSEEPAIPSFLNFSPSLEEEISEDAGSYFEPVEEPPKRESFSSQYVPAFFSQEMPSEVSNHEPTEPSATYVCSKCGAPVNKAQHDFSMLFNHKILCKDCMK